MSLETWQGRPVYGPVGGEGLAGVVILHGSEGPMAGWAHRFAVILAAHGVLALPHSYGTGDFWGAGVIGDVPVAAVLEAVSVLSEHPRCRGAGVLGWSMGAELALVLAAGHGATDPLRFVAAHAAPAQVHGAFDPERFRAGGDWRQRGAEAPRAWVWPGHETALTPGAEIAIEAYPGPLFLSIGLADDIRDPADTDRLEARRRAAGLPVDVFRAGGQGHAFDFDREPELWQRLLHFIEEVMAWRK